MKNTGRLILIFAFLMAIVTSGLMYLYLNNLDESVEIQVEMTKIVVASEDIYERTLITSGMIQEIEVAKESLHGNFINAKDEIVGLYAAEKIYKDEQFHAGKLQGEIADKLNLKIKGSHRAISVSISGASGIANILEPGDFVDIVAVLPELKENNRIVRPDVAKIILQNIEVLAIDKQLYFEEPSISDEEVAIVEGAASKVYIATLSVPFQNVEPIALVERIGTIELALRPLDGDHLYTTEGTVWQELLLNEFGEMKDMFPAYDIVSTDNFVLESDDYRFESYTYYTVLPGDTLRSISRKFYGTENNYQLLKQVNTIIDENIIVTGTGIKVPVLEKGGESIE